jgi:hypothetical protein
MKVIDMYRLRTLIAAASFFSLMLVSVPALTASPYQASASHASGHVGAKQHAGPYHHHHDHFIGLGSALLYDEAALDFYPWWLTFPYFGDWFPYEVAPFALASYYYCANPPGYYPDVTLCQSPWQPVPITAP